MLSFACVLLSVGYDRLDLDAFMEPRDPLISGTTAILLCDDDDVRVRSPEGRLLSPSSVLLEAEERVLRVLELLWRSRSLSLSRSRSRSFSLSRSLLLGLLESFLVRRRWVSDELIAAMCGTRCCLVVQALGCWCGQAFTQRGYGPLAIGRLRWAF